MEKNSGIIESRLKIQLSLTNFYNMKNFSNKNPLFSNYILNTYYPNIISSFDENVKNIQNDVKTSDIGIQCNLENNNSEDIPRTKIVEDEWFFIKDKDI